MHRRWYPALAVAAVLLVSSVISPGPAGGPAGSLPLDKLLHAAGYAALAGALVVALTAHEGSAGWVAAISFCGAVGYGIAIELVQTALRYRTFEVWDLAANASGALIGAAAVVAVRRLRN